MNELLQEYSAPVVMGICVCIGYIVKKAAPTEKLNRFIPLIVGALGILLNAWMRWDFTPSVVLGGLVSGLASTGIHEALGQIKVKSDSDNKEEK